MFNKDSKHSKNINKKINNMKTIKLLGDPNFTKLTVFTLSICLIIYLLLPCHTQITLQQLLQHPVIIGLILVFCLLVGYINTTVSISLIVFVSVLYFNHNLGVYKCNSLRETSNIEGFKNDIKSDEEEITKQIKDLFSAGPFVKTYNKNKKALKEVKDKEKAKDTMMTIEAKVEKRKSRTKSNFTDVNDNTEGNNVNTEGNNSGDNDNSRENFKPIPMRKFNPAEKEDTDLLMVMDHCKDISNRIKYEYEDNKYLKKYIRDKLEDIIDTLDLVEED